MPRSHRWSITSAPPPMHPRMGESGGWPHRLPAVPTWRARHVSGAHRCSMPTCTGNHPPPVPPAMTEHAAYAGVAPCKTDAAMPPTRCRTSCWPACGRAPCGACPLSIAGGSGGNGWVPWPPPEILDGYQPDSPHRLVSCSLSPHVPGGVPQPGPPRRGRVGGPSGSVRVPQNEVSRRLNHRGGWEPAGTGRMGMRPRGSVPRNCPACAPNSTRKSPVRICP